MPYLAPMLRSIALRSGPALATALALACGAAAMRSLAADGAPVTLKTTQIGEGPALVFVPDAGLGRTVWMPTARKLLAGHRIVLVDLPGHGESPMLDPFTLPAAAEALDQVLARLNGDSTIVIGQGVGGVIAALAAKAHPDHLRGLVLIDVGMRAPMKIEDQQRQMFLRFMDENFDQFVRMVYGRRGRDSTQSDQIVAQASLVPPSNLKPYFREMLGLDGSSTWKGFAPPVLYVGTERGWPSDKPWAALAAERGLEGLAKPDTARIPASAQLVMKDQPDSLAAVIAKFEAKALAAR